MNFLPISLEVPEAPLPVAHLDSLLRALDTERRLIEDLTRVMTAQRSSIAADDLEAIDESVFSAQRVLRTIQEAREQRRTLFQLLGLNANTSLRELDEVLGAGLSSELRTSRDRLLDAAQSLSRELTSNRQVIDGALSVGDQLLRVFTGDAETPTLYAEGSDNGPTSRPGQLFNTRV